MSQSHSINIPCVISHNQTYHAERACSPWLSSPVFSIEFTIVPKTENFLRKIECMWHAFYQLGVHSAGSKNALHSCVCLSVCLAVHLYSSCTPSYSITLLCHYSHKQSQWKLVEIDRPNRPRYVKLAWFCAA